MTWRIPASVAFVLLALALVVAKAAAGSTAFEGRSVLIVLSLVVAFIIACKIPERTS